MLLPMLLVGRAIAASTGGVADHERFVVFPEDRTQAPEASYEGSFGGAPVPHWEITLPGGRLNAAAHTERTRPVVVGDEVLVGSAGGRALYRLSRHNGSVKGTYPAGNSVESAPVVVDDRVYFADTGGVAWAYELDGDLLWSRATGAPILVQPTVHDGVVYVTNVDDLAVALDANDGDLLWQYQRRADLTREAELALYAAPPAVVVEDLVLLGFSDGALVALDRARGDVLWDRRIGEGRYPDLVAAPVVWGTDVYASGYFEPLVALDLATQNVRWRLDHGAANAVAIGTETEPALVYHPGTDGKLRAVVALTGAVRWTWDSATTGAVTTPVLTPAGLLIGSSEGGLWLLDPESGEIRWTYDRALLDGVTSTPTIDGRQLLFVTNAGRLYSMLAPMQDREADAGVGWLGWRRAAR